MRQRPRAIARAQRYDDPIDVARPFVWVAVFAFATGFCGYLSVLPLLGGS